MSGQLWNPTNPAARPVHRRTDDSCLPADLIASIPDCAIQCVQEFVLANYVGADCSFISDLSDLCINNSISGLTIGEGSVQCVVAGCSAVDLTTAYNVCSGVPGAAPNTATLIVATKQPATTSASSMSTEFPSIPASIGAPESAGDLTSVVMASGAPAPLTQSSAAMTTIFSSNTIAASQTDTASTASAARSSGNSSPEADRSSPSSPGLDSSQKIGIGLGAAAAVLITIAFLLFLSRHRKTAGKRRSRRRSVYAQQTPPPRYDGPLNNDGLLSPPIRSTKHQHMSQRFYAGVPDDKRRSFWRRSIRPDEIGVAISPKPNETNSPTSISSHQSLAKLLPNTPQKAYKPSAWASALNYERDLPARDARPTSDGTLFDEDLEAQMPPGFQLVTSRSGLSAPPNPRSRQPVMPQELRSGTATMGIGSPTNPVASKMPLTPTYDNGNFPSIATVALPPSAWKGSLAQPIGKVGQSYLSDDEEGKNSPGTNRKVLRKNAADREPAIPSSFPHAVQGTSKSASLRKDSETTAVTEIEESSTLGETEDRPGLPQYAFAAAPYNSADSISEPPRSPISNLRYPTVPRSAAVSRQAEHAPQPRQLIPPPMTSSVLRPSRDALVRNKSSFMVTDTTSSDGYLSDQSMDWPAPPGHARALPQQSVGMNHGAFKANMSRLKSSSEAVERGPLQPRHNRPVQRPNPLFTGNSGTGNAMPPQRTKMSAQNSSSGADSQADDLYFTVEI